jgi:hypothetical protein
MTITLQNTTQLSAVLAALGLASTAGAAEPSTADLVQIAKDRAATKETAAKPVEKSAKADPAPGQRTAKVEAAAAPAKTAEESDPSAGNAEAEHQASTAAAEVSYEQVAKAITDKVKTDRAHVIATLAAFKVAKGPELKPAQYADFLKALG